MIQKIKSAAILRVAAKVMETPEWWQKYTAAQNATASQLLGVSMTKYSALPILTEYFSFVHPMGDVYIAQLEFEDFLIAHGFSIFFGDAASDAMGIKLILRQASLRLTEYLLYLNKYETIKIIENLMHELRDVEKSAPYKNEIESIIMELIENHD